MKFYAFDLETGGTDPKRHFPVQVGLAVMDGEDVIESAEWIVAPPEKNGKVTKEYDVMALGISGLSWRAIRDGQSIRAVMQDIRFLTGKHGPLPVVSHNASFDQAFWSECVFACGEWDKAQNRWVNVPDPFVGPWYCTRRLAGPLELADGRLDTLAASYGLSRTSANHGALEDAILCGRCFARLMRAEVPA